MCIIYTCLIYVQNKEKIKYSLRYALSFMCVCVCFLLPLHWFCSIYWKMPFGMISSSLLSSSSLTVIIGRCCSLCPVAIPLFSLFYSYSFLKMKSRYTLEEFSHACPLIRKCSTTASNIIIAHSFHYIVAKFIWKKHSNYYYY